MIVKLENKNYLIELGELEKACFSDLCWTKEQVFSHLENGQTIVFKKEAILSYLFYLESDWEIEILRIGTKIEFQNQGFGESLIAYLKSHNKEIFLEVSNQNEKAIRFYEKNGFQKIHIRKKYYSDGSDAFLFAWKP